MENAYKIFSAAKLLFWEEADDWQGIKILSIAMEIPRKMYFQTDRINWGDWQDLS